MADNRNNGVPSRSYVVLNGNSANLVSAEDFDQHKDEFYSNHPDGQVFSLDGYNPDADSSRVGGYMVDGNYVATDEFLKHRDDYFKNHPDGRVDMLTPYDYWGEKQVSQSEDLARWHAENDEFMRQYEAMMDHYSEDGPNMMDQVKFLTENADRYNQARESFDALNAAYHGNPAVQAAERSDKETQVGVLQESNKEIDRKLNTMAQDREDMQSNESFLERLARASRQASDAYDFNSERRNDEIKLGQAEDAQNYRAARQLNSESIDLWQATKNGDIDAAAVRQTGSGFLQRMGEAMLSRGAGGTRVSIGDMGNNQAHDSAANKAARQVDAAAKGVMKGAVDRVTDAEFWDYIGRGENTEALYGLHKKVTDLVGTYMNLEPSSPTRDGFEALLKKNLSESEWALYSAYMDNANAMAMNMNNDDESQNIHWSYKAGQSMADSAKMMVMMMLFSGLTQPAMAAATGWMDSLILDMSSGMSTKIGQAVVKGAGKFVKGNAKGLVGGAIQTVVSPDGFFNALDAMAQIDQNTGKLVDTSSAIFKSLADDVIENGTELGLGVVSHATGEVGDVLLKGLKKLGWDTAFKFTNSVGGVLAKAGIGNLFEEWGEEVDGAVIRTLTGLDPDALKDFATLENQLTLMVSFALPIGGGAVISNAQRMYYNNRYDKSRQNTREVLERSGLFDEAVIDNVLDSFDGRTPAELVNNVLPWLQAISERNALVRSGASPAQIQESNMQIAMGAQGVAPWIRGTATGVGDEVIDALVKHVRNTANKLSIDGKYGAQMQGERDSQQQGIIANETGGKNFWFTRSHKRADDQISNAGTMDPGAATYEQEIVHEIMMADGSRRYIVTDQKTGKDAESNQQLLYVDSAGNTGVMTPSQIENETKSGNITGNRRMGLRDYLDTRITEHRQARDSQRIGQERQLAIQQIIAEIESRGGQINIGTDEVPHNVSIQQKRRNGVIVYDPEDAQVPYKLMTWEELGGYVNVNASPYTEEQLDTMQAEIMDQDKQSIDAANGVLRRGAPVTFTDKDGADLTVTRVVGNFTADDGSQKYVVFARDSRDAARTTIVDKSVIDDQVASIDPSYTAEAMTQEDMPVGDDVLRDFRGNPIPMYNDGDGDQINFNALWNRDPEAWCRLNDERKGSSDDSIRALKLAIQQEQTALANIQKNLETVDFNKRDKLLDLESRTLEKLREYSRILDGYIAQQQTAAAQEAAQMVADSAQDQAQQQTLQRAEHDQAVRDKAALIEAYVSQYGDVPTHVVTAGTVVAAVEDLQNRRLARMAEEGRSQDEIDDTKERYKSHLDHLKANLNRAKGSMNGFHYMGEIFLMAETENSMVKVKKDYHHERQHYINQFVRPSLIQEVIGAVNGDSIQEKARNLYSIIRAIAGGDVQEYMTLRDTGDLEGLADEVLAFCMQEAAIYSNLAEHLSGFNVPDVIINIAKEEYERQKNSLPQTRPGQGGDVSQHEPGSGSDRTNGGSPQEGSGEVEEQGSGSAGSSGEAAAPGVGEAPEEEVDGELPEGEYQPVSGPNRDFEPLNLTMAVAQAFSPALRGKLNREDWQAELGFGDAEMQAFWPFWAKKGTGMTLVSMAESIAENDQTGLVPVSADTGLHDTQAVRDAIIDLFSQVAKLSDLYGYNARMTNEFNSGRMRFSANIDKVDNEILKDGFTALSLQHIDETVKLINNGTEEYNRIPRTIQGEMPEDAGKNVEASIVARAGYHSSPRTQDAVRYIKEQGDQSLRQQIILEDWARARGIWYDNADDHFSRTHYTDDNLRGAEAVVYIAQDNKSVIKVYEPAVAHSTPIEAIDDIMIHNLFFYPPVAIEGMGKTVREGEEVFCFILSQPYVVKAKPATPQEIEEHLYKADGLTRKDERTFTNDKFLITDLHEGNIFINEDGDLICIDNSNKFNTVMAMNGGKYELDDYYEPDQELRFSISPETQKELDEKDLVFDGGLVMSREAQDLKNETGYQTPNELPEDLKGIAFSLSTVDRWAENYRNIPGARESVIRAVTSWADRAAASELVSGVLSQGEHPYYAPSSGVRAKGKQVGPIRTNVEYVVTFDMDTTCPRTFQYLSLSKTIERRIGRPLTQVECIQLIEMMRAYGNQIPCVYCYAENKRQAMKQYYTDFMTSRHAVISAETDEEALKHMYGRDEKKAKKSSDPAVVLTSAAQEVFKTWRQNRDKAYNPSMKTLWYHYSDTRNSILTDLDIMLADGKISIQDKEADIVTAVAADLRISEENALKVVAEIVSEWKWDAIEGRDHQDFFETDEDDIYANENALTLWREMTAYAKSASGAKSVLKYVPYTDELRYISQEDKDYINGMGGLRMHSTNDFRIDYVLDYFQFMADMAANGMLGHTYTKSPEFVRIFGNSGYKINMSIAAYQDADGKIRMNEDEGFNWEIAKALREAFPNAGVMLMATSDEQIQMALDEEWIDMFIPFHHSGLPVAIWKDMRAWTDYTTVQNERFYNSTDMKRILKENGIPFSKSMKAKEIAELFNEKMGIIRLYDEKGKRIKPHFLPGPTKVGGQDIPGHGNSAEEYFRLCRLYGVHPRFKGVKVKDAEGNEIDITEHPGYIKCIKETARTDNGQSAIEFNFDQPYTEKQKDLINVSAATPLEYAFNELEARAMAEAKDAGHPVDDIYTSAKKDVSGIVDDFIGHVIKHKDQTGKDYPIDYLTPDSRKWFMVERKALQEAYKDVMEIPYHPNVYDENGNVVKDRMSFSISPEVREEMDIIEAEARLDGTYMKAPNGMDTKLSPEQWAMVRTKSFMNWFGDWINDSENASKVVDTETGEPRVVYHVTDSDERFNKFDSSIAGNGFFFSDSETFANEWETITGKEKYACFMNLKNPNELDAQGRNWAELSSLGFGAEDTDELAFNTREAGYDGLILHNVEEGGVYTEVLTDYVAFNSDQVKSATENNGNFDPTDPDIRFSISAKRKDQIRRQIHNKLTVMTDQQLDDTIAEIERLGEQMKPGGDSRFENSLVTWVSNGLAILPQDSQRCIEAYGLAKRFNVNPDQITNLVDFIDKMGARAEKKDADKNLLNPDTLPELSNKTVISETQGIVVYDVEDSREGQRAVRKLVDSHFGSGSNPWCLISRLGDGDTLDQAWDYWQGYGEAGRKIAFQNGKLIAFMSSSGPAEQWWDRLDRPHKKVPVMVKFNAEGNKVTAQAKINDTDEDILDYDNTYTVSGNGVEETYDNYGRIVDTRYTRERDGVKETVTLSYEYMNSRLNEPIEQVKRGDVTSVAQIRNGEVAIYQEGNIAVRNMTANVDSWRGALYDDPTDAGSSSVEVSVRGDKFTVNDIEGYNTIVIDGHGEFVSSVGGISAEEYNTRLRDNVNRILNVIWNAMGYEPRVNDKVHAGTQVSKETIIKAISSYNARQIPAEKKARRVTGFISRVVTKFNQAADDIRERYMQKMFNLQLQQRAEPLIKMVDVLLKYEPNTTEDLLNEALDGQEWSNVMADFYDGGKVENDMQAVALIANVLIENYARTNSQTLMDIEPLLEYLSERDDYLADRLDSDVDKVREVFYKKDDLLKRAVRINDLVQDLLTAMEDMSHGLRSHANLGMIKTHEAAALRVLDFMYRNRRNGIGRMIARNEMEVLMGGFFGISGSGFTYLPIGYYPVAFFEEVQNRDNVSRDTRAAAHIMDYFCREYNVFDDAYFDSYDEDMKLADWLFQDENSWILERSEELEKLAREYLDKWSDYHRGAIDDMEAFNDLSAEFMRHALLVGEDLINQETRSQLRRLNESRPETYRNAMESQLRTEESNAWDLVEEETNLFDPRLEEMLVEYEDNTEGFVKALEEHAEDVRRMGFEQASRPQRIRFSMRPEADRQKLFDTAVEHYGTTTDFGEAGYMLPDGRMLDFSEKNDGGQPGRRSVDHRDISGIINDRHYDTQTEYLDDFINEGAIRLMPESGAISVAVKPTKQQKDMLRSFVYRYDGEVEVEIYNDGHSVTDAFYRRRTSPSRVLGDINDYFDKGVIPEGNEPMFSISASDEEAAADRIRYSMVTDQDLLDRLDNGPKRTVYRAMQLIDGKLYPPMSAYLDGNLREPSELGVWEQSDENPELANPDGTFKLDKGADDNGNRGTVNAAYNPYFHTSFTPLNDQFSAAQTRSNLVIVEVEIPESELTSRYRARNAKDHVGEMKWHSGPVSSILANYEGKERRVVLSRWARPVRIVDDAEIAKVADGLFKGTYFENHPLPSNVVTPGLRSELEKLGYKFVETDNQGSFIGENGTWAKKYGSDSAEFKPYKKEQAAIRKQKIKALDEEYAKAVKEGRTEEAQTLVDQAAEIWGKDSQVRDEDGNLLPVYHGTRTDEKFWIFDTNNDRSEDKGNVGSHFGPKDTADEFGSENRYKVYLNLTKVWETFDFFADIWNNAYLEALIRLRNVCQTQEALDIFERIYDVYPILATYDIDDPDIIEEFDNDEGLEEFEIKETRYGKTRGHKVGPYSEHRNAMVQIMRDMMKAEGYDGIAYENWYEGEENNICYVALYPEQIKSAEAATYNDKGKLIPLSKRFNAKKGDIRFSVSYHGTGAVFDRFDHSHMSEGEGAQAHGWGTYVTFDQDLAGAYATKGVVPKLLKEGALKHNGQPVQWRFLDELNDWNNDLKGVDLDSIIAEGFRWAVGRNPKDARSLVDKALAALWDKYDYMEVRDHLGASRILEARDYLMFHRNEYEFDIEGKRNVYTVDIPEDNGSNYLDEDRIYDEDEVEEILKRIADANIDDEDFDIDYFEEKIQDYLDLYNVDGRAIYQALQKFGFNNDKESASHALANAGYVGIKYVGRVDGPCAVIFQEENARITDRMAFSIKSNARQEVFVSNALQAVEALNMTKAPAANWIKAIQGKGGLKAGEDKWIGLTDWLNSQEGQVSRDDVMNYIRQNQIQIEETYYGEVDPSELEDALIQDIIKNHSDGKTLEELQKEVDANAESNRRYDELGTYYDQDELDDWLMERMREEHGGGFHYYYRIENGTIRYEIPDSWDLDPDDYGATLEENTGRRAIDSTRLNYTTRGLDNKREIALTVPNIYPYNESDNVHFGDAGEGRAVAWIRFGETVTKDGQQMYDDLKNHLYSKYGTHDEKRLEYRMSEDDRKALAGADAKKNSRVLVIDEIQSKRHQDGREKGYLGSTDAAQKLEDFNKSLEEKYGPYYEERMNFNERLKQSELIAKKSGVPDAPFEKNWHELAMKRMLRLAAEEGYDKIAWTNGDMQAERYDIGNVLNTVEAGKWTTDEEAGDERSYGKESKSLVFYTDSNEFSVDIDREGTVLASDIGEFTGKKLSEVIGKELADSIISEEGSNSWSGDQLRVGGEGMKGFYDDILPRFMNKYGKKWGVHVHDIDLPGLENKTGWHAVDVTPEMKESVMRGQPMFSFVGKRAAQVADAIDLDSRRLDALEVAQKMEAAGDKTPQQIKLATGWERGADNQWRMEIPDIWIGLDVDMVPGSWMMDEFVEDTDEYQIMRDAYNLSAWRVELVKDKSVTWRGLTDTENKVITLNLIERGKTRRFEDIQSTFIHEIQHLIQENEGFARGGNASMFKNIPEVKKVSDRIKEIKKEAVTILEDKVESITPKGWKDKKTMPKAYKKTLLEAARMLISANPRIKELTEELIDAEAKVKEIMHREYERLGGEVEARNVQLRARMLDSERASTVAADTAEYPAEEQLIWRSALQELDKYYVQAQETAGRIADNGLDKELGRDSLDDFAMDFYGGASEELKGRVEDMAAGMGYNFTGAVQNILAESALDYSKEGSEIIDQARRQLAQMGYSMPMREARWALWGSAHPQTGDILDEAERISTAIDLGMDPESVQSRRETVGRMRFSQSAASMAKDMTKAYNFDASRSWHRLRESIVDQFDSVQRLVDAVVKFSNKPVKGFEDVMKSLNQQSSRALAAYNKWNGSYFKPLLQTVADIIADPACGYDYDDVVKYMLLKHGVERTQVIGQGQQDAGALTALTNGADLQDCINIANVQISAFEDRVGKERIERLWKLTKAATDAKLDQQLSSGLISREQYEKAKTMFQYYVPMKGSVEPTAEDVFTYIDDRIVMLTGKLPKTEGRETLPQNPFGHIARDMHMAIAQGLKNESKQALYFFLSNRGPSDLYTISDTWYELVFDANGKVVDQKPLFPVFTGKMDEQARRDAYDQWIADMKVKEAAGMVVQGDGKIHLPGVAHIDDRSIPQHCIVAKINGQNKTIVINGNPRAAQAINGLINKEHTDSDTMKSVAKLNRWIANLATSLNPDFWLTNAQRDLLFAFASQHIKGEGMGNMRRAIQTPITIYRLSKAYEEGTLDKLTNIPKEIRDYYEEFATEGAITGYTAVSEYTELEKAARIASTKQEKAAVEFMRRLAEVFVRFGESIEQMTRFAAYVTARRNGSDVINAVDAAKEISVNFNRKGSSQAITWEDTEKLTMKDGTLLAPNEKDGLVKRQEKYIHRLTIVTLGYLNRYGRNFIMFYNAAVQGLNAAYKLWEADKKKTASWVGGVFALGALNAMIQPMLEGLIGGDDDDDKDQYLDVPDYDRRNSVLLGANGVYFKWALPQEAKVFYSLGDAFVNKIRGVSPEKVMGKEIYDIVMEAMPYNPTNVDDIIPAGFAPLWENWRNKDFTGAKIYNDMPYLDEADKKILPNYQKAYRSTKKVYVEISKVLNDLTGGDETVKGSINLNPGKLENLVEGYTGGAGKFLSNLIKTTIGQTWGESFEVRTMPFLRRLLTINDERTRSSHTTDLFNYYKEIAEQTDTRMKKYRKSSDESIQQRLDRLMESDEYKILEIYQGYESLEKQYRKYLKDETDQEARKALMREQDAYRRDMIRDITEALRER